MELRHLRYFVAVAERGSFVEASKRLYVSQSAISEQIADLEAELGGALFSRKSRRPSLTPQGKLFLDEARKVLSASTEAVSVFKRGMASDIGTLTIGFFAWGIGPYFTKSIREFRQLHPGVHLELHEMLSREQMESLGTGKIDIGLGRPVVAPFDRILSSELLYSERIVAVLPAEHPLADGPVDLSKLASERFVMRDRNGIDNRYDILLKACLDAGFQPEVVSTARTWNGVASLVEAGVGVALAPGGIKRVASPGVAIQPLVPEMTDVGIAAAWNPKNESRLRSGFLDILRKHSKEEL
ncbi:MAG: LysR family transcriptional regulator [Acidobacteriaceae bacterium]|nr:LysR family transcriptional regulator [Acidobacteriaceae bacterium]